MSVFVTFIDSAWGKYYPDHISKWLSHAKYWLQNYTQPLHVIIYRDMVEDLQHQLPSLMQFFGYTMDQDSRLHRHCCVLKVPFNPDLKRKTSAIDEFKEQLIETDSRLSKIAEDAVHEVQTILDQRWPGIYTIRRG